MLLELCPAQFQWQVGHPISSTLSTRTAAPSPHPHPFPHGRPILPSPRHPHLRCRHGCAALWRPRLRLGRRHGSAARLRLRLGRRHGSAARLRLRLGRRHGSAARLRLRLGRRHGSAASSSARPRLLVHRLLLRVPRGAASSSRI
jgi:hypothetical protein